ncbi:23S rRNA pseudouridine(1911/1915/1917) synthase RluD [Sulfurirhabdus autotrophica]|uniref:Pseudouridine synthase n=1 Tax=Sulfurirhabdus autotrophica TaxID=1706046 RepID=A0A4R3YE51_9PROT|nr:23S rRNA pseudouridine(1911/1915/1917) synthase RluD [Sulfurirhabdus autotrophica]TCV90427.1 23S rRNA pseudouridine1911/1915/1917 synthase [Sulfurirhabdus autotrophica]
MSQPVENFSDYNLNDDDAERIDIVIPDSCAGFRLDQALQSLLPDYSRSRLQTWIKEEKVMVDDKPAIAKQKVWGGENISVIPEVHPSEMPYLAEEIALNVVYEDDTILIVNKPAGLVVHPGSGNWQGTLLNALLHHAPQVSQVPRAGIVHRLDKDTSGLLVVAKTLTAQTDLVRQLQARTVKREYLAIARGQITQDGKVVTPIGRHPKSRTKMAVVRNGKPAITYYHVLENFSGHTLVQCRLETGRTHQIRVHMQSIGHPLAGDQVYIGQTAHVNPELREPIRLFGRQALHATRLGLIHPVTHEPMEWEAEMPQDMVDLLEVLRKTDEQSKQ